MFCTPATAPDPYAADAPPVTESTRSMRIDGMKFRSTPSPWLVGTKRRVFTRVSVRLPKYGFRPRRFAIVEPVKKLALPVVVGVLVEMFDGSCVIAAPTFTMPRFSRYDESTTVVGLDVSKSV